MTQKEFEVHARSCMSKHFGVTLAECKLIGMPKRFDLVSADGSVVGDAKYLTLVGGVKLRPSTSTSYWSVLNANRYDLY
jgi:hypothetical protein